MVNLNLKEILPQDIQIKFPPKKLEELTSFFNTDLAKYISFLEELEKELLLTNDLDTINKLSKKLNNQSNEITKKGENILVEINNKKVSKIVKDLFRNKLKSWFGQSKIMLRGLEKPKGYPGDFFLLELIYNNQPISEGIGLLYDKAFQMNELAIGVRYRKDKTKEIIKEFINNFNNDTIRILNLACGSSRELRELFKENKITKKVQIDLVDFDEEALFFSKEELIKTVSNNISLNTYKENILELIRKNNFLNKKYDLVYSIGLADYFPDKIFKLFTQYQLEILSPNGKVIISHKDFEVYQPIIIDWFCDWTFYSRSFNYVNILIDSIVNTRYKKEIIRDVNNPIFFISVIKNE